MKKKQAIHKEARSEAKKTGFKEFARKLHQKKAPRFLSSLFFNLTLPILGPYAYFVEPRRVQVTHTKVPIKNLGKGLENFKIVQMSDIHFGPTNKSPRFISKCVEKINKIKPDIVVLTGDFMQWDSSYAWELGDLLKNMETTHGIFACLGNHDYGVCHKDKPATDPVDFNEVIKAFESSNIRVLHNEKVVIQKDNHSLTVAGIGDFWTQHFKPEIVLEKNKNQTTVVLCHNPDGLEHIENFDFDLVLSGHTHGGQISFPIIGPIAVPVKNKLHVRGLHSVGKNKNQWLYTNRGLGYIFKARLFSRPEIALLELEAA